MTVSTTLKYFFLPCLLAAAIPLRAAPAPMQATSTESARIWTDGYGTGNGRLGILSFGVFPKEIVVFNEGSIFAKKNFQMKEGAAEALDKAVFILAGITEGQVLQAVDAAVAMNQNGDLGLPVPNYVDENVSDKVVKIIQSYTGVVNKMVWRKY